MTSFYTQFLTLHREAQVALSVAFDDLGQLIAGDILRLALPRSAKKGPQALSDDDSGHIAPELEPSILDAANARLGAFFLGTDTKIPVLEVDGEARPNSPYATLLWPYLQRAAQLAKERQRAIIERQFKNHPDVWQIYQPFWDKATSVIVQEMDKTFDTRLMDIAIGQIVVSELTPPPPRPVATYDPPHRWVKPDGYRLSDRIWITDEETRRRLDLYISAQIRAGTSSTDLAQGVIQFLNPNQGLPETNKPYGRKLSYNAMRLGRTEISAAYAQADIAAARANPLVTQYQPLRTRYGKPCNICDPTVDAGPYDILDDSGIPPLHPHCLCRLSFIYSEEMGETIERLRAELRDKHPELFDQNGAMGLADRVRVNTSKWFPGQLAGPDPILVRSTVNVPSAPLKINLADTFVGTFEGDLYVNAHRLEVQNYIDGLTDFPKQTLGSQNWVEGVQGLNTTYKSPSAAFRTVQYTTEGLNVGGKEAFDQLLQEATERATALFSPTHPLNVAGGEARFSLLVREQFEHVARGAGFDAFMWADNQIAIVAWEKVTFAQAYTSEELLLLSNPNASKPLLQVMDEAAERFQALHAGIDDLVAGRSVLAAEEAALNERLRRANQQVNVARESYLAAQEADPQSALTKRLFNEYTTLDNLVWQIQTERDEVANAIIDYRKTFNSDVYSLMSTGPDVDLQPLYQPGYKRGKNKKKWDEAFDFTRTIVNGDIYDDTYVVSVFKTGKSRSYENGGNIYMNPNAQIKSAVHELGHSLEHYDPYTHQRCVDFFYLRTSEANVEWLGGNFLRDELADKDDFISAYIGKLYGPYGDPYATEVLSMGLQYMYQDPVWFYEQDPQMFDFIVGLISGWI